VGTTRDPKSFAADAAAIAPTSIPKTLLEAAKADIVLFAANARSQAPYGRLIRFGRSRGVADSPSITRCEPDCDRRFAKETRRGDAAARDGHRGRERALGEPSTGQRYPRRPAAAERELAPHRGEVDDYTPRVENISTREPMTNG